MSLHENTGAQVHLGQNLSKSLQTTSGMRQGCILTSALFSIAIEWILCHMTVKPGIAVGRDHFGDLAYADDMAFLVKSEAVSSLNSFSETASALGLWVSWPKTKLQNLSTSTHPPINVVDDSVEGDNFIYLGSVLSSDGYSGPDINRHTGLASSVMSALSHI